MADFTWRLAPQSEWGAYVHYYKGQDYYNIHFFSDQLHRFVGGAVWGISGGRPRR